VHIRRNLGAEKTPNEVIPVAYPYSSHDARQKHESAHLIKIT
jgi:hypothetical protein